MNNKFFGVTAFILIILAFCLLFCKEKQPINNAKKTKQVNQDLEADVTKEKNIIYGIIKNSQYTEAKAPFIIYTPPNYTPKKKYPLLIFLHGLGQSPQRFITRGNIHKIMDNLITNKIIKPFIILMPSGFTSFYVDEIEKHIMEEVIPYVEKNYSIATGKENYAIAGMSMGGFGAFNIAYRYQETFGLSVPISMAGRDIYFKDSELDELYSGEINFYVILYCGAGDQLKFYRNANKVDAFLTKRNIPHEYYLKEDDGTLKSGHSWFYYNTIMEDVLKKISDFFYQ